MDRLYTHQLAFIKEIAPTWRKTQVVNLTLLVQALFRRRSLVLTELARAYPIPSRRKVPKPKHGLLHRVKRLWRFLHNPGLVDSDLMTRLTRLSYSVCRSPGLLLPILMDLTYIEPFAILSAHVPRGGRALPIAWRVYRRNLDGVPEDSQNLLIQKLVREMVQRIAPNIENVIIADREFASASFFRFLKGLKTRFVIRIDAQTWIDDPCYSGPLAGLAPSPSHRRLWLPGALYGKEEREPINLLAMWLPGFKEPWFIASNLDDPCLVERLYGKRMKIEHGYRDWKHHLRLKGTARVLSAQPLGVLITGVILLYWYVSLLGQRLTHSVFASEVRSWGKLGAFKQGLELLALIDDDALRDLLLPNLQRLNRWVADKLLGLRPPTPSYRLRCRRYRASLIKTGYP